MDYILQIMKNLNTPVSGVVTGCLVLVLIGLLVLLTVLLIRNRKQRKFIRMHACYTLKSETLNELTLEINRLHRSIAEKELSLAGLDKNETELKIQIEQLKGRVIEDEIIHQEYTEKNNSAKTDYHLLKGYHDKLFGEIQLLETKKTLLEKEQSHLSFQKSQLEKSLTETIKRTQLLKNQQDEPLHIRHIGYNPKRFIHSAYPVVIMPQPESVLKLPRPGRMGQCGLAEKKFEKYLELYFKESTGFRVFTDRILAVSDHTRPYEPDFTLQLEKINLLIDIEIDEPYNGYTGHPSHVAGQDNQRDRFFTNRGWMVIRFSEKQAYKYPRACCKWIARIITEINPDYVFPPELLRIKSLTKEEFWTKETAERWAGRGYREDYLKTGFTVKDRPGVIPVLDEQTPAETDAEKYVRRPKHSIEPIHDYNRLNATERDKKIAVAKEPLQYSLGREKKTIWAATLIKKQYPFALSDPENLNTTMRLAFHNYILGKRENIPVNDTVFKQFLLFYTHYAETLTPYRTNWNIMDVHSCILGTVDLLSDNQDGTFSLYNWKIADRIKGNPDTFNKELNGLTVEEYNYVRYSLEMNIYKRILETNYQKPISGMYLVQLHRAIDSYTVIPVEVMNARTEELFSIPVSSNEK